MKKLDPIEKEINRIRVEIYEETKHMTMEERMERLRKIGEEAAKRFGFKLYATANEALAASAVGV